MIKEITLALSPEKASAEKFYLPAAAAKLGLSTEQISFCRLRGRSIDARHGRVQINLRLDVYIDELPKPDEWQVPDYPNVEHCQPVVIVGAGPAGLFAALKFLQLGLKPVIVERGKDVHSRRLDITAIHRNQGVNPDSNYGFGEGGAGTYSDGKLFTRSKKRGDISEVLRILYANGGNPDIMVDAHPHIGTDKLPGIIENIRKTIIEHGGQVLFGVSFDSLILDGDRVRGIRTTSGDEIRSDAVILATGHSAREVYYSLHRQGVALEPKAFAMGVRVEHPQSLIDSIQYSCRQRGPYLPAAAYSLVQQSGGRGVYSFCMCPGGIIVPASTADNEMVVNGMSPSARGSQWANSAIVVELRTDDIPPCADPVMAGLEFQMQYERLAFNNGGAGQIAPAQRLADFVEGRVSGSLPRTSFTPGIISSPMHQWLPDFIRQRLQDGLRQFDRRMRGFYTNDAVLIGVESRTSSPLRIPRDPETLQHVQIQGLFPCGEGAGYAGGIVSSALDGQRCAEKAALFIKNCQ